jgi:hypothetical protein
VQMAFVGNEIVLIDKHACDFGLDEPAMRDPRPPSVFLVIQIVFSNYRFGPVRFYPRIRTHKVVKRICPLALLQQVEKLVGHSLIGTRPIHAVLGLHRERPIGKWQ